jgi:hypothetical protein
MYEVSIQSGEPLISLVIGDDRPAPETIIRMDRHFDIDDLQRVSCRRRISGRV